MEALAKRISLFFLQRHYIESDQMEWLQYGLTRRMMGFLTFVLLLPVGAVFVGWLGSFLYVLTFRFLRTRTGGYHARTPHGCLLSSLGTMVLSLTLAKFISSPILSAMILAVATFFILMFAPANNASLHLTESEIMAIHPRVVFRLAVAVLLGAVLLCFHVSLANCIVVSVLAVASMLLFSNCGFGVQ